jgi:outer membrane protein
MIKKKYLKILAFCVLIFYSNIGLSNSSVRFIDMEFLMNNSLAGKSIKNQLDKISKSYNEDFKKKEESFKKKEIELVSKKKILNKDDFNKEVELFNKQVSDYKITRKKKINNLSKIKNDAQKKLADALNLILADYSEKNSIDYIIAKQAIVIGATNSDLTKKILEIINDQIKMIKLN